MTGHKLTHTQSSAGSATDVPCPKDIKTKFIGVLPLSSKRPEQTQRNCLTTIANATEIQSSS